MFEQLGLIGCGLIGGSFALALKRAKLVKRIVGYSRSPSTTQRAQQLGAVDAIASCALQAALGADLVLVAVPVAASEAIFEDIRHGITAHTLLMDVGSTKCDVIEAARRGLRTHFGSFVATHPIAGKEVGGIEHAEANLFANRKVVLTPVRETCESNVQRSAALWSSLGAQVVTMTPEAHDKAFAAVSHLPHLVAFAFMQSIVSQPEGTQFLELAGPGFKDFSRIAASVPAIWRDILLANREQILAQSLAFRAALQKLESIIAAGDAQALEQAIAAASQVRARWSQSIPPTSD